MYVTAYVQTCPLNCERFEPRSHFVNKGSMIVLACAQTKLNSGSLRLRNSAEIVVLDFQLCTQIWVLATIGQLKKAFLLFVVIANQDEEKFETHFR